MYTSFIMIEVYTFSCCRALKWSALRENELDGETEDLRQDAAPDTRQEVRLGNCIKLGGKEARGHLITPLGKYAPSQPSFIFTVLIVIMQVFIILKSSIQTFKLYSDFWEARTICSEKALTDWKRF